MEKLYTLSNPSTFVGSARLHLPPTYSNTTPPKDNGWSSPSEYSSSEGVSSPASDDVPPSFLPTNFDHDWDILSDILINDALSGLPPASTISSDHSTQNNAQNASSPASSSTGDRPADYSSSSSVCSVADVGSVGTRPAAVRPSVVRPSVVRPSAVSGGARKVMKGRRHAASHTVKKELLTLEEQKKQRRRSQIASSVQRHREKKKCLVSALQAEMTGLMQQVTALRAMRRSQMADNDQLVAYQEEAMTQRRKRRQAEHTHQELKQALFHQTSFLNGLRSLMSDGNMPCSKTLEFHDWVHSYTALASRDMIARRKEYIAHFPKSKMDLATNLVLKNTYVETQHLLASGQMYMGKVRMLHDGTRNAQTLDDGLTDVMMRKLLTSDRGRSEEAGDGRVVKEFTSVFLFLETTQCTIEALMDLVFTSMRSVGVYYPSATYQSRAVDEVLYTEADGVTKSSIYYTELVASMEPVFEAIEDDHEIKVEARVITREQRSPNGGMILWDYVDDDTLNPLPSDAPGQKIICRNVCGGMVIRKEPGTGMISVRHTSMKAYSPLPKAEIVSNKFENIDAEEARRTVTRHIALQASECDRLSDRCTRHVYDDITRRLNLRTAF
ncbi:uncharacterized protein PHALS_12452 [Plasmopara halstedii]|uniref:Uncharacterized protein n=1 Tax=Plasmopara halstedii TaxID=4781 RepID=A0A0P1AM04_PLAHL|nr:uncharacterized protein PHALS_12452 [Plasmopara halstedii]CEG42154.1 hypothetical protein PHALS_12452 [Plasmopara halstedii]|eukprot:XP_024578523.1 hypothetical protein PHALS_12452 [Plasmopara halstedii]